LPARSRRECWDEKIELDAFQPAIAQWYRIHQVDESPHGTKRKPAFGTVIVATNVIKEEGATAGCHGADESAKMHLIR
jgi:hypothetical protein